MDNEVKLCRECKWGRQFSAFNPTVYCTHRAGKVPWDTEHYSTRFMRDERSTTPDFGKTFYVDRCGPEAKHWEAKPPAEPVVVVPARKPSFMERLAAWVFQ